MKPAAIGMCAHSGWGALVAIAGTPAAFEVVDRRRIAITDPAMAGANQPYHFAQGQSLDAAERHLMECAANSERLASAALREAVAYLRRRQMVVVGCAILLAAGRTLPPLPEILKSHSLIHTAEGEFFRRAFWMAGERLEIPVTGYKERDLEEHARQLFGVATEQVSRAVADMGKTVGPPWTKDQKNASLAALFVLAAEEQHTRG